MILLKDNISSRAIDYTKRMSINFIGVRKQRVNKKTTGLRSRKLYFSQSYNKVERHDFEIEDYVDQQVSHQLIMLLVFSQNQLSHLKYRIHEKSYWKLLSDFNFNYLPSNVSFNTNINRQYNRQQFRQVDVQGLVLILCIEETLHSIINMDLIII
jgi:cell surface protein SprA